VVEIDNRGIDPLLVSWVEVDTKATCRVGEAGLGRTVLPVPEYVRARMARERGYWNVQSIAPDGANPDRPNYRLNVRCADARVGAARP